MGETGAFAASSFIATDLPAPTRPGHRSARPGILTPETIARYLTRIGLDDPGEPSAEALQALHRAHVERVPYEVVEIHLGRPQTVRPHESVARILRGRGGYCFQLNGAFATLLAALGYRVTWHVATVQASAAPPVPGVAAGAHLVSTVDIEGTVWLVDVGLGDALHQPLPLRVGTYQQGPFGFRLGRSGVLPGGWRFDHDARGSIVGLDFGTAPAAPDDFTDWHRYLSTSPDSRLVRALTVMRRDATGADRLTGCMLRRVDGTGQTVRELTTPAEWYGALADVFDLPLSDVDAAERAVLWARVRRTHDAWLAARADRLARAA